MGAEAADVASIPPLKPVRTAAIAPAAPASAEEEEGEGCVTPKEHVIKTPLTCPPAPKKPRPAPRKMAGPALFSGVACDLTSVFLEIPVDLDSRKRIRVS